MDKACSQRSEGEERNQNQRRDGQGPGVSQPCSIGQPRYPIVLIRRLVTVPGRAVLELPSSTTPTLPWPTPCPRRSAGSACPTVAPHWRRRNRGSRFP